MTYPASEATVVQMNSTTPEEVEMRDASDEAQEESLVEQIRGLLAQLIAGEAAELAAGDPASMSLQALVGVLTQLEWWEEVDEMEDGTADSEEMSEDAPAIARALSTADALAELRALTAA